MTGVSGMRLCDQSCLAALERGYLVRHRVSTERGGTFYRIATLRKWKRKNAPGPYYQRGARLFSAATVARLVVAGAALVDGDKIVTLK